jgi:hypothetical protein
MSSKLFDISKTLGQGCSREGERDGGMEEGREGRREWCVSGENCTRTQLEERLAKNQSEKRREKYWYYLNFFGQQNLPGRSGRADTVQRRRQIYRNKE